MAKPAKNRVRVGSKSHKNMLELSFKKGETHAHLVGHLNIQTRNKERGPPPPILNLKTKFLPLKFPWNSMVKRAQKVVSKGFEK